ncbi:hypothetical protein [Sphingorhabdus sp. Alg231-15]|uniref:hypothetical protein n=1 Tax=Sphingorhabdus sp. Alg231-15 TaxID=1922222 RepID=UPI000D5613C9
MRAETVEREKPKDRSHRDPGSRIVEQLQKLFGADYEVTMVRERPWASITFSGTRHILVVKLAVLGEMPGIGSACNQLPDYEFNLPGQFVADILVHSESTSDQQITIELLTINDPVDNG